MPRTPDTGPVLYGCCECPVDDRCIAACSWFTPSPCLGGSRIRAPVEEGRCYQLRLAGHFGDEPAGELKINVGPFCGNDQFDPELFFGPKRCVGGANDSLVCTSDADCPDSICGEECDGGSGCGADCQCMPGWCPMPFPSRNCYACEPSCVNGRLDGDDDVDLFDHERFHLCLTGPAGVATPDCRCADSDGDGNVDIRDFAWESICFSGIDMPSDPHCATND